MNTVDIDYDVNVSLQEHPESKTTYVIIDSLNKIFITTVSQRDYDYVTKRFIGRVIFKIIRSELKLDKYTSIQIVQQKGFILNQSGHPRYQGKTIQTKKRMIDNTV